MNNNERVIQRLLRLVESSEALQSSNPPLSPERIEYERGYRNALMQTIGIMEDIHWEDHDD